MPCIDLVTKIRNHEPLTIFEDKLVKSYIIDWAISCLESESKFELKSIVRYALFLTTTYYDLEDIIDIINLCNKNHGIPKFEVIYYER